LYFGRENNQQKKVIELKTKECVVWVEREREGGGGRQEKTEEIIINNNDFSLSLITFFFSPKKTRNKKIIIRNENIPKSIDSILGVGLIIVLN
jgi:hypothetical protein